MNNLPQELKLDVTEQFKTLLVFGLSHGLDLVQKQGELIPMVITLIDGKYEITVLTAPSKTPDRMTRDYIANLPHAIDAYAILLQGQVPLGEKLHDAIIVLGGERVRYYGHRLAQPYRRNLLRRVTVMGEPIYGGRTEQFIHRV